ncbi:hypothetical protein PI124_g7437 [Phytophthora idaei]|nr:hypothetical protein PI125_g11871 [Phytophthora idaei]KAG3247868.1 hypothetical protein PI124_g7437 [Phytophthora idaei]
MATTKGETGTTEKATFEIVGWAPSPSLRQQACQASSSPVSEPDLPSSQSSSVDDTTESPVRVDSYGICLSGSATTSEMSPACSQRRRRGFHCCVRCDWRVWGRLGGSIEMLEPYI